MNTDLQDYSHKRYNILTGEWVLVSPHRAKRPWQGQNEEISTAQRPKHDPSCYLCAFLRIILYIPGMLHPIVESLIIARGQ